MSELRNVLPGYEPEQMDAFPDDEDPMTGFGAGDRVEVNEEHPVYPGEQGVVQAIGTGKGIYAGQTVVDVLIDGTETAERFTSEEVFGA